MAANLKNEIKSKLIDAFDLVSGKIETVWNGEVKGIDIKIGGVYLASLVDVSQFDLDGIMKQIKEKETELASKLREIVAKDVKLAEIVLKDATLDTLPLTDTEKAEMAIKFLRELAAKESTAKGFCASRISQIKNSLIKANIINQ